MMDRTAAAEPHEIRSIKQITLSLTAKYASSWGTWEGIRELVQNWHDGILETKEHLDLPLWSQVSFRQVPCCLMQEHYQAFTLNAEEAEIILGTLIYDAVHTTLTMINKNTSLHRKILLLGYSKKAETQQVIGEFGEGLKIGALSLVREGRVVTMETNHDRWQFDLAEDENFGEKVLTVFVTDRVLETDSKEDEAEQRDLVIGPEDTATRVNLETDLWNDYKKRFLFLCSPKEFVHTELGTLLLEPTYRGHLYLKGVWVSDLSNEDLAAGVDFAQLQLDRDRNATPRPSEIDHIVSCIWIKALDQKPELAAQYFRLLQENQCRDVRHALAYATDNQARLIAEQFTLQYGENIFAVSHSTTQKQLELIRNEISNKVVLCNNTLLELLLKSGKHISLEEALANRKAADRSVRPFQLLTNEEKLTIQHAVALVGLVDRDFSTSLVDVLDSREIMACSQSGSRILVPYWMISRELTHKAGPLCRDQGQSKCMCREVRLCCAILKARANLSPSGILNTLPPELDHVLLYVLQPLALQLCKIDEPFCSKLHKDPSHNLLDPTDNTDPQTTHKFCIEREADLQKEVARLQNELQTNKQEHSKQLEDVRGRLGQAEKDLVGRELSLVNSEQKLEAECQKRVSKAQEAVLNKVKQMEQLNASLEKENATVKLELKHSKERVKKLRAEMALYEPSIERKNAGLVEELLHYVEQCKKRTKSLQRVCQEKMEKEPQGASKDKYQLLYNLSCVLSEDLQKDKFLCIICTRRRKEVMLLPCGHYQLCRGCAHQMDGLCPTCRKQINETCRVFE